MTSRLTLYNTEITPDRNAKVDNVRAYLESCDKLVVGTFQYMKMGLELTIKVAMDQQAVAEKEFNYACIEQDGRAYYFFLNGARWVAKKTVAFDLVMDTINTWWDDLVWNGKTTISRQHMDRFSSISGGSLTNRIDRYNEGFNPTLNNEQVTYQVDGVTCYIVYKTRDGITQNDIVNPISATVYYDEAKLISTQKNNPVQTINWRGVYEDDQYYFITDTGLENASLTTTVSG